MDIPSTNMFFGLSATILLAALSNAGNLVNSRARSLKEEPSPERFNYFDVELLKETNRADSGNVVISPASIKTLMAMVLEGSGGQTAEQLRQALRLEESTNSQRLHIDAFLRSLQDHRTGYIVEMGNRIFVSDKVMPRKEYEEALVKYYYADVQQVDFTSPQITAVTINDWVNNKTHGYINRLVEPDILNPYSKLMLVNAIYFKGNWKVPFDPDVTSVKNFYPQAGVCHKAFYMEILESYPYAYIQELDAQALELPYEGNKFSMLLLMPRDTKGINQLIRDLPYSPIENIISKLVRTEVLVSIPRFKVDYSTDLVSSLSNLDIKDIFGPHANLSGMLADGELTYITNVFHKAKIEVNEEGSIAGAATGAIAVPLIGRAFPKFHPNRPFLFYIRNVETGSILFEGQVTTPELASKTCSDLNSDQEWSIKPSKEVTNTRLNQQVPNIQQANRGSQQRPSVHFYQPSNNSNSGSLRPPFNVLNNSGGTNNSTILGKEEHIQYQNYAPRTNLSTSGDRDAIQFFNSS